MAIEMFEFIVDPGHGWLVVPESVIDEVLGERKHEVTSYSYYKDGVWYLEEDCDATLFKRVYEERFGCSFTLQTRFLNRESSIRSYARVPNNYSRPSWHRGLFYK